jgi:Bacteriophage HK97-gp10, putative tail-component
MPDRVTLKIDGLSTIDANLRKLAVAVQEDILRNALHAGGKVLRDGIARKIRSRTGRTIADLRTTVQVKGAAGIAETGGSPSVKGNKKARSHILNFLEFGTKPHVEPKKRKGPRISVTIGTRTLTRRGPAPASPRMAFGGKVFSRVKHPGTRAQAPMRRTISENGIAAVNAFGREAWAGIRAVVERR